MHGKSFGSRPQDIQVCHIIPHSLGGIDYVFNMGLYEKRVNAKFSNHVCKEWRNFVGADVFRIAMDFACYNKKTTVAAHYGMFDPKVHGLLARGRS